jgi:hypothetical protein
VHFSHHLQEKTKHLPLSSEPSDRKVRYEEDAFVRNITNNYFEEKKEKKNVLESLMEQLFTSYPNAGMTNVDGLHSWCFLLFVFLYCDSVTTFLTLIDFEIVLTNQDYSIRVHR